MRRFKNLLYVVYGGLDNADGLKQALSLARNNQAKLSLLIVSPDLPSTFPEYVEKYQDALTEHMLSRIDSVKAELGMADYDLDISSKLITDNKAAIKIVRHVILNSHDMVIKESEAGSGFDAIDMQLLRKCPCAVWLCRPIGGHRHQIKVAAAIDPQPGDPVLQELAESLLSIGRGQADDCSGELHIVSCWNNVLESELRDNAFIRVSKADLEKQVAQEKAEHMADLNQVISGSGIAGPNHVHQLSGKADKLIPKFVSEQDVDVLVMGTVSRTGIPGFLIGNTAENIVQRVSCSLLAIKPRGFVSPVKPD